MNFHNRVSHVLLLSMVVAATTIAQEAEPPAPPAGATLETSADADSLLNRALDYIANDQYREALLLLQHVNDNYGDVLTTTDGRLFVPARETVERTVRSLPAEGLREYRLTADGEASGMLDGRAPASVRDADPLRAVAERYFVSSIGDEAAFALAARLLDQGRHHAARRWLMKILNDHPDPTVDRTQLHARLLAANAGMGDRAGAQRMADRLRDDRDIAASRLDALMGFVERTTDPTAVDESRDWPMAYGGPRRMGLMPAMGDAGLHHRDRDAAEIDIDLWAVAWEDRVPLSSAALTSGQTVYHGANYPSTRPMLNRRWLDERWQPTARAVIDDQTAVYKLGETVTAIDLPTGRRLWSRAAKGEAPQRNTINRAYYHNRARANYPATMEEMVLFGDRVGRSIAVIDKVVYHVVDASPMVGGRAGRVRVINGRPMRVASGSALQALNLKTGKVLWEQDILPRSAGDVEAEEKNPQPPNAPFTTATRVLGSPVRAAGSLIVPVDDMGELYLVALDAKTGQEQWRRFMCASGTGYGPPWAPIELTVSDGLIYVPTGRGLLMAADAETGQPLWASRYQRIEPDNRYMSRNANAHLAWAQGAQAWVDNVVMPMGGELLMVAADAADVIVFDAGTGRVTRRYDIDQYGTDIKTLVGVADGRLVVGGQSTMAAIELDTGKLAWKTRLEGATGAAVLAGNAVFAPVADHIVRIDLITGKWQANIPVSDASDGPVGNLYSDGQQLLAMGVDGMVGLVDIDDHFARLNERIAAGDAAALIDRAQLYRQVGRTQQAADDYRAALAAAIDDESQARAREQLLATLLALAATSPETAEAYLDEAEQLASSDDQRIRVRLVRADTYAAGGNLQPAIAIYADLVDNDSQAIMSVDPNQPNVVMSLSHVATARIRALVAEHGSRVGPLLESNAAAMLTDVSGEVEAKQQLQQLAGVTRTYPSTNASLTAAERLTDLSLREDVRLAALAEAALRSMAASGDQRTEARSKALLAKLYNQRDWPVEAAAMWRNIADQHSDQAFGEGETAVAAKDLAQKRIASLRDRVDALADPLAMTGPPYEQVWKSTSPDAQIVTLGGPADQLSSFLQSHVLLYSPSRDRLIMRDARTGAAIWSKSTPSDARNVLRRQGTENMFAGGRDGHILVITTNSKINAYDLFDGQLLWSRDGTGDAQQQMRYQRGLMQPIHVGAGLMLDTGWAEDDSAQVVRAYDLLDGKLLWERRMEEATPTGVYATPQYAIIAVDGGDRLIICDAQSGLQVGQRTVEEYRQNGLAVWTERGVIYQAMRGIRFAPYDDTAEPWELMAGSTYYRRIDQLNDQLGSFVASDSTLGVFELATGKIVMQANRKQVGNNAMSVALGPDGKRLYAMAISADGKNNWELKVFNVEGEPKVEHTVTFGRFPAQAIDAEVFARAGRVLPFAERDQRNSRKVTVRMFGLEDGQELKDLTLKGPEGDGTFEYLIAPPMIRGGSLIIPTRKGVLAYGLKEGEQPEDLPELKEPEPAQQNQADDNAAPPAGNNPIQGANIKVNNGNIQIRMNNGGVIRAGNIRINNLEIKQNDGKVEIYRDGKLIEVRDADGKPIDLDTIKRKPEPKQADPSNEEPQQGEKPQQE